MTLISPRVLSRGTRPAMFGVLAFLTVAPAAQAQTDYYWNAPTGGTGTWNTTSTNWSNAAAGPVNVIWSNSTSLRANFGNTAGTVTLATVTAYGVNFTTTGYTLTATTLTLNGAGGPINTNGLNATINSAIAGTVGLTMTSAGTLTLGGTNTYTAGGTNVQAGTIVVTAAAALPTSTIVTLGSGSTNGVLQIGTSTTAVNPTIAGLSTSGAGTGNAVVAGTTVVSTLTVNNTSAETFSGTLGGSGTNQNNLGLTLASGAANLTLNAANTFTGGLTVSSGDTLIGMAQAAGSPFGGPTGAITVNNSTLSLQSIAATTTATAGALTFSGASNLIIDNTIGSGVAATTTLAGSTIARSGTGTLIITPVTGALGTGEKITLSTGAGLVVNGILPSYVVALPSIGNPAADFVTYGASGVAVATYSSTDLTTSTNASVVNQIAAPTITGPVAAYALKTSQTIDLATKTLTLGNGAGTAGLILIGGQINDGILSFGGVEGTIYAGGTSSIGANLSNGPITVFGSGSLTISGNVNDINPATGQFQTFTNNNLGGALTIGTPTSTISLGDFNGVGRTLVLASAPGTASNTIINSIIQDPSGANPGVNGGTVSITATGTVQLNGLSTYTGGTSGSLTTQGTTPNLGAWPASFIIGTNISGPGVTVQIGVSTNGPPGSFTAGPFGVAPIYTNNGTNPILEPIGADRTIANAFNMNSGFVAANAAGNPYNLILTGPITLNASRQIVSNIPAPQALTINGNITLTTATSGNNTNVLTLLSNMPVAPATPNGVIVINGLIQNPVGVTGGVVTISSAGTFELNAQNTYSGGTNLTGAGSIIPIPLDSVVTAGVFTSGPFGTGAITVNNGTNQHLRPMNGNRTILNQITMTTGFAMDNATSGPDATSNLTFGGPIVMQTTGRFISNGFATANVGGTMILGLAAAPSTITLPTAASQTLSFAALSGPIVINDVIQQPLGIAGAVNVNPNTNDNYTVTFNGASTYTGNTTIGTGVAGTPGTAGIIQIGVSSTAPFISGPFGTGTVIFNNSTVPPNLQAIGADRTVANALTLTSGFFVSNPTLAQDPTGPHNLILTGAISDAGKVITNNLVPGVSLYLGLATSPATLTMSGGTTKFQTQTAGVGAGTTVINDLVTGAGALTVQNGATVVLTNANSYTGVTQVIGGTLLVNNTSGSGTGTNTVTANGAGTLGSGGTLGGTGSISGLVTIGSTTTGSQGGIVYPGTGGSSAGTLSVANMSWSTLGRYVFAHSATSAAIGGGINNFINGSGTLDLSTLGAGSTFDLNLVPLTLATAQTQQTYTIANFVGGIPGFSNGQDISSLFTLSGTYLSAPASFAQVVAGTGGGSAQAIQLTFTPATVVSLSMWTGTDNGNWSDANNWSPSGVPASGLNAVLSFGATTNAAMTNDTGAFTLNLMTFVSGSPAYTLGGGALNFVTNGNGALPQIINNSANTVAINTAITLTNNLSVSGSGNIALNGAISGAGSLTMNGSGILTLGNAANSFLGGTNVLNGTVQVAADGALGSGNVTGNSLGTLSYTGTTATTRSFTLNGGTVSVAAGQIVTFNSSQVSGGYLDGAGTFATNATNGAQFNNMISTPSVTINSNSPADQFSHFTNGGLLNVAANVIVGPSTATFNIFTNQGSGTLVVGANAHINVSNFQSNGEIDLLPGAMATGGTTTTVLKNIGSSPLAFNSGSRTFVATVATAGTFSAGVDLNGQNAVVVSGLFVNNGYVIDSSNNQMGTNTVIADFGALVKGAGFFQNSPQTRNGGRVQAGNSPGAASFGQFVFGPGGVSNYVFAIDNATGVAGPTADASGQVSGWGLAKAVRQALGSVTTGGNFVWTADANSKLAVSLETLVNPTIAGTDPNGLMANFDPNKSYSWPAVEWSGAYSGPTTTAALDASTLFDTSEFANPIAGSFGWNLDPTSQTLSLTYTPSAVPEPGTLALCGLAAAGLARWGRRGRKV